MPPGLFRSLLLWGAPLAFGGAILLHPLLNRSGQDRIQVDRSKAIESARRLASSLGVNPDHLSVVVSVASDSRLDEFLQNSTSRQRDLVRLLLNPFAVAVTHVRSDGSQWFLTSLRPDGSIGGFRRKGAFPLRHPASPGSQARYAAIAQAAVLEKAPRGLDLELGQPDLQQIEGSGDPSAARFQWRANLPQLEGIDADITVEVEDQTVTRLEFKPFYEDNPAGRAGLRAASIRQLGNVAKLALFALAALYGCYRYARRALEQEVPHRRALVIALVMLLFGITLVLIDPAYGITGVAPENFVGWSGWLFRIVFVCIVGVQGILMALAYGAGEGEIREGYPGKLTSLDCLLVGRPLAANVGRSLMGGAAAGAWVLLGFNALLVALQLRPDISANSLVRATFARGHWAILLLALALSGVLRSVLGLLLPMTFVRRQLGDRRFAYPALAATGMLLSGVPSNLGVGDPAYWLEAACATAALIGAFWAFDYLASIVAAAVFAFGSSLPELARFAQAWSRYEIALYVVLGLTAAIAALIWRFGREYDESEVRPQYARNLVQRLAMRAELDAARQAQLRLLPDKAPSVRGLSIAASCTPASEVSGDYYDFFPLPGGLLGIAVAEGGNDGLASALTIALTKGFLMVQTGTGKSPREILDDLLQMLGHSLKRSSAHTGVLYAVLDPAARTIEVACTAEFPKAAVLCSDGSVTDVFGVKSMAPRDTLLFYTDGIPRMLAGSGESPHDLLRRAAGFHNVNSAQSMHDAILRVLVPVNSDGAPGDDLTAVVIHFEQDTGVALEHVA